MNRHAIEHKTVPKDIYPSSRNNLIFRMKAARNDVRSCRLVYWPRTKTAAEDRRYANMSCVQRDDLFDYFQVSVHFRKPARYTKYFFELTGMDGEKIWVSAFGLDSHIPEDGFFEYLYANDNDVIHVPDWAKGQIYYQIFPDRFYNGDHSNDLAETVPWGSAPTRENFMGGDLAGIIKKLDYIQKLGADCLYLTPIFKATFNHKYDTSDYYSVDPGFGTHEDLKELVEQCHSRGMKILLDGVFNHCGVNFAPFQDLLKNQEKSAFRDWFYVTRYPVAISHESYECVGGYKWMPKLRSSNPEVRRFILDVMDFWIKTAGIDGWRLDVADEVDYKVWQYARAELKSKYPESLLIGESWGDASKMLEGDQMDCAMNYVFRDAVKDFFAAGSITASEFDARINRMLANRYDAVNEVMYNLLDSHDTPRFLRECGDDIQKYQMAVAFQLLFCGSPAIYYGDEAGLTGDNDPDCRKAMVWNDSERNAVIFDWYRQLIQLRKNLKPLYEGSFLSNLCDSQSGIYGFVREAGGERVYVAINNSSHVQDVIIPVVERDAEFEDCLTNEEYKGNPFLRNERNSFYNQDLLEYSQTVVLTMKEYSVKILKIKQEV